MPKLLVLYDGDDPALARLADAIAAGARTVRFAEVDLRRAGDSVADAASRHRVLDQAEELGAYDGIALGISAGAASEPSAAESVVARFGGSLASKVGSAFTATAGSARRAALWRALTPMADREMILVPPAFEEDDSDMTRLGARLAEVIGWVTHARSHHHHH